MVDKERAAALAELEGIAEGMLDGGVLLDGGISQAAWGAIKHALTASPVDRITIAGKVGYARATFDAFMSETGVGGDVAGEAARCLDDVLRLLLAPEAGDHG
jgi:hypothetical protein